MLDNMWFTRKATESTTHGPLILAEWSTGWYVFPVVDNGNT